MKSRKIKYPFIDKQWFIDNWINTTKTLKQLANELNINDSLLEFRASKFNLTKQSKYPFNRTKFYNLNDYHIWYLGGLMATDGYMVYNHDAIEFSLTGESEFILLNSIKQYYNSLSPIKCYKSKTNKNGSWRLRFLDKGIQEFFINNFGLCLNDKTNNVKTITNFPNEDCAKAYIRGCIDGDGCIGVDKKKGKLKFSILNASENFIEGIKNIVYNYTGIELPYRLEYRYQRDCYYPTISTVGSKVEMFLDWVYSLQDCFYLERKKEIYTSYKETHNA